MTTSQLQALIADARRAAGSGGTVVVSTTTRPESRVDHGHGWRLPGKIADPRFLRPPGASAPDEEATLVLSDAMLVMIPAGSRSVRGLRPLLQRCEFRRRSTCALSVAFAEEMLDALREHHGLGHPSAAFSVTKETLYEFREASPSFGSYTGDMGAGGLELGAVFETVEIGFEQVLLFDRGARNLPPAARVVIGLETKDQTEAARRWLRQALDA